MKDTLVYQRHITLSYIYFGKLSIVFEGVSCHQGAVMGGKGKQKAKGTQEKFSLQKL